MTKGDIKKRAIISVSNKNGLQELALALVGMGMELVSTGGTAAFLDQLGIPVTRVSDVTNFPEIMDGRVKTLHPNIHGGILARRDDQHHQDAMRDHNIAPIGFVIVNLYPFMETIKTTLSFECAIENIDIGGPAMIRAAAKNHDYVTVVTDPCDYSELIRELGKGGPDVTFRRKMAAKAFAHTAVYDGAITQWLAQECKQAFPLTYVTAGRLIHELRYGENPHQKAAFYRTGTEDGLGSAQRLQGKEMSYNNIVDGDAALSLVAEFSDPAAVIVKHANPCGVAVASDLFTAYSRALDSDPMSAFGGIVALNRPVDDDLAKELGKIFLEVVIAPAFSEKAIKILVAKKNLRLLELPIPKALGRVIPKWIRGGFLLQDNDSVPDSVIAIPTVKKPTEQDMVDLMFLNRIAKHVASNAIVIGRNNQTLGIGAGQMSRIDAVCLAGEKAGLRAMGACLASDAFFPFPDSIDEAARLGVGAIIQPGGAQRDAEVTAACDRHNIAMVLTGRRHFRH